ncbi:MAG: tetratricopeptide repeat protein [Gammaproteobacteria bacterium]|nr:tetratricopeptide repeat protein [Gammaproteobacteria bacterium]
MFKRSIGIVLLSAWLAQTAYAGAIDEEIQRQLRLGQPQAAWTLAQQHLSDSAGEPAFDFAAGLAALEAGQPQHAVMALERVLLVQPSHHRARLELARAYYQLGDYAAARREFQAVDAIGPPPNVRRRVESFLAEIQQREDAARTQVTGYVELRPGWDSNVSSATADSSVDIPAFGVVSLDADSRARSDRFLDKNAGVTLVRPLDKRRALFADVAYRDRENVETQLYDTRSIGVSAGMAWSHETDRLRLPVQYQVLYLANAEFRRMATLGVEWSRDLDARNQLLAFGQLGAIRYPDDATRDVNLLLGGGGWNHRYAGLPLLLTTNAYLGDESARASGGDANGRTYYGARLGTQWTGIPMHTPYASLNWQHSGYAASNSVFVRTRSENFAELRLGWGWQPQRNWNVTAEASLVDNGANIALYDYTRRQYAVGVRYQFD